MESSVLSEEVTRKFTTKIMLIMVSLFGLKWLQVWFYSARNNEKGWPFDTFLFQPADRFTDFLIPWAVAGYENIWDPSKIKPGEMVAPPYGYLQYEFLGIMPFRTEVLMPFFVFVLSLLALGALLWLIWKQSFNLPKLEAAMLFGVFLITNFALHFEIDRGNLDLYGAIGLAALVFIASRASKRFPKYLIAIAMGLVICLKPSYGFLILPVLLTTGILPSITAVALIIFNYLIPILFLGAPLDYLQQLVASALTITEGVSIFCHSLSCGASVLGIKPPVIVVSAVVASLFFTAIVAARVYFRGLDKASLFIKLLLATTLMTLLANSPSNDYRLTFLMPFFAAAPVIFRNVLESRLWRNLLVTSGAGVFGYVNILVFGFPDYFTPLRTLALLILAVALGRELFLEKRISSEFEVVSRTV